MIFVMMNLLFHDDDNGWAIIRNLNEEKKLNLLFSGMEKRCWKKKNEKI